MRWDGDLEAFLESFISPENTDEAELKAALMSVPPESWSVVEVSLKVALHNEKGKYLPEVQTISDQPIKPWLPTDENMRIYDVTVRKEEILLDERYRRQR